MSAQTDIDREASDCVSDNAELTVWEDDELTDQQLEQVVGGLDRGWWPEADDFSDRRKEL